MFFDLILYAHDIFHVIGYKCILFDFTGMDILLE
jgi:hypothetical protein